MKPRTAPWTLAPAPHRASPGQQGPTARQIEVLDQVAQGKSNNAAAGALHLGPNTISRHVRRLWLTWDAVSRAHLVGEGFRRRWLVPERVVRLPALAGPQGELISLLGRGATHPIIAAELDLSLWAVRQLETAALGGLGVRTASEAVALWHCSIPASQWLGAPLDIPAELTSLQRQLFGLVICAASPEAIAGVLDVPVSAVPARIARLRHAVGARTTLEAIGFVLREGLVTAPARTPVRVAPQVVAVLAHLARGEGVPQIAVCLEIPVKAVWRLLGDARAALGTPSRLETVVAAYGAGILMPQRGPQGRLPGTRQGPDAFAPADRPGPVVETGYGY